MSSALSPAAPGPVPSRRGRKEGLGVARDLNSRPLSLLGSVEGWVYWHGGRSGPGLGWGPAVRAGPRRSPPHPGGLALPSVSRVCMCIYVLVAFV